MSRDCVTIEHIETCTGQIYRELIVSQVQVGQRNLGRSKEARSNFRYHIMRQIQYFYIRMIERS